MNIINTGILKEVILSKFIFFISVHDYVYIVELLKPCYELHGYINNDLVA